jgi:hypothetical protein
MSAPPRPRLRDRLHRVTALERAIYDAYHADDAVSASDVGVAFGCTKDHVLRCLQRVKDARAERLSVRRAG